MPRTDADELAVRCADFECSFSRTVEQRLEHGFIHTFRPGFDDGPPMRSWATTREYRKWCEENLEPWLGYCPPERTREAVRAIERKEDA